METAQCLSISYWLVTNDRKTLDFRAFGTMQALKDFFTNAYITVFSRISYKVVQQIVQLNTVNVNLFVGKLTKRFFVLAQFIGKFIVNRVSKMYLLLLEYISIDVCCNSYVAMTKMFRDHFQIYPTVQQKRSITVSQLM